MWFISFIFGETQDRRPGCFCLQSEFTSLCTFGSDDIKICGMRPAGNDHWRSVDLADKLMHGASDFVTFRHVWLVAVHRLHRPSDNQQ